MSTLDVLDLKCVLNISLLKVIFVKLYFLGPYFCNYYPMIWK